MTPSEAKATALKVLRDAEARRAESVAKEAREHWEMMCVDEPLLGTDRKAMRRIKPRRIYRAVNHV